MSAVSSIEKVGDLRRIADSFRVDVVFQDGSKNDPNMVMSCFTALNLLPRFLKMVRYKGDTGILGNFPPSHTEKINLGNDDSGWKPHVTLVFGKDPVVAQNRVIYVGSAGWSICLSTRKPCGWDSAANVNRIAAMYAGTLAVGEVFKMLLSSLNVKSELVDTLEYDLVTHGTTKNHPVIEPKIPSIMHLEDLTIVGCGAIGQALIVALANSTYLSGRITLVDQDKLEPSNEQRYILGYEEKRGQMKVNVAQGVLGENNNLLSVTVMPMKYEDAMSAFEYSPLGSEIVASVDNERTRINIQAALPRLLWNAWTDVSEGSMRYGVGRHTLDSELECVACSYFPKEKSPSSQLAMNAIRTGIPEAELQARIAKGDVCKPEDVERIAKTHNLVVDGLRGLVGMPLKEILHGECGVFNVKMPEKHETTPAPHAPVMAGTILASQIILSRLPLPDGARLVESVAEFESFSIPSSNCLMKKRKNPSCFCNDPVYVEAYRTKWKK
ncbi:MAG: ThiF family adenylyltransferase [Nitrososphaera sp.]